MQSRMPYQFFIAFRYLRSKKKNKGISLNTAISAGGVAVGVMVLLVVLSVMSGFHEDLQNKILGFSAHAVVLNYKGSISDYNNVLKKVAGDKDVISASPFVLGQLMVSSGKRAHGALLRGIDPSYETKTTDIAKYIKRGSIDDLNTNDKIPGIVIGKELAQMLGVLTGDTVNVISPVGEIGPLGMLPKMKEFRVVGIFEVGMFEYDSNLVLTNLSEAQKFFDMGNTITGIELKVKDIYKATDIRKRVESKLDFPFYSRDWMQMHKNLFSALKLEKLAMFIILVLIILVASFNIVGSLIMNVVEKSREIAILKTMGATNKGIMSVFMLQGLFVGLVGMLIGLIGGYLLCILFNNVIRLPADVYYLSHLPIKMKLVDFVTVSVSAVLISFLSTIYPAWQAAKMDPVEPLRYE
jgi:lipoprotein-releasing system permease protein